MPTIDEQAANLLTELRGERQFGLFRGVVESIDDPDRQGKVQVRIWAIHGDDSVIATRMLPWAEVGEIGGGGYDFGSFDPPPVGSGVWVEFEMGYVDCPVILGTFRGTPVRDDDNPNVFLTKGGQPIKEKPWLPPNDVSETPLDIFENVYKGDPHPTRRIWRKSFKGHTLIVEEGDGKEFLKIIDRAGQIIEMDCAVKPEVSAGNAAQRGTRNAIQGDQLGHGAMVNERASIRIKDLSGQEILLEARDRQESIMIKSRCKRTGSEQFIRLNSGPGKESIELTDTKGDTIRLDPNSDQPIVIADAVGNAITFDKEKGTIAIQGAKGTEENVQQKTEVIGGTKESTVKGDSLAKILGNAKIDVANDATVGVGGSTTITQGGMLSILINNMPMTGIPNLTDPVLQLIVAAGSLKIGNKLLLADLADLEFDAAGKVELYNQFAQVILSKTGGVEMSSVAGNAGLTMSAAGGAVQLYNSLADLNLSVGGIANLNGEFVQLGSSLASINHLVKGEVLTLAWTPALITLSAAAAAAASTASTPTPINNSLAIATLCSGVIAYTATLGAIMVGLLSKKVTTE